MLSFYYVDHIDLMIHLKSMQETNKKEKNMRETNKKEKNEYKKKTKMKRIGKERKAREQRAPWTLR